jgi:hypothetical protein
VWKLNVCTYLVVDLKRRTSKYTENRKDVGWWYFIANVQGWMCGSSGRVTALQMCKP